MRRDLDIPHWTIPVPPETEYDSNTQTRQVTQAHNRPHQRGMRTKTSMRRLYGSACQRLRKAYIGLMLPTLECSLMADECQDLAANFKDNCGARQDLQGAGWDLRHRLSGFARGAATFVVR